MTFNCPSANLFYTKFKLGVIVYSMCINYGSQGVVAAEQTFTLAGLNS